MSNEKQWIKMKKLKSGLAKLMSDNRPNLEENPAGYDKGYAEGFHDAILDVMMLCGIASDEEYYN